MQTFGTLGMPVAEACEAGGSRLGRIERWWLGLARRLGLAVGPLVVGPCPSAAATRPNEERGKLGGEGTGIGQTLYSVVDCAVCARGTRVMAHSTRPLAM